MSLYHLHIALHFVVMCLVGNKNDLEESREVNVKDAQEYADSIGALFHETSALKNVGKDTLSLSGCMFSIYTQNRKVSREYFNCIDIPESFSDLLALFSGICLQLVKHFIFSLTKTFRLGITDTAFIVF